METLIPKARPIIHIELIGFRTETSMANTLRTIASEKDVSVSDVIRYAIRNFIEQLENQHTNSTKSLQKTDN